MKLSYAALAVVFLVVIVLLLIWQKDSAPVAKVKAFFSALGDAIEAGFNKVGLKLIVGWRRFYAMYSMWAFAALGSAPDIYNLAVAHNMLGGGEAPALLVRTINTIAFIGAMSKLIEQKKLAAEREKAVLASVDTKEESDTNRL